MDFPYIASYAELDKYEGVTAPWHWHPAVELFYMESGTLEYTTPTGKWVFPAGSGGLVNSNVLHIELIPLYRDNAEQADLLKKIRAIFELDEEAWAYEFNLRQQLTEVWLQLFDMSRSMIDRESMKKTTDDKVKEMMEYIHTHYQEKITVEHLTSIANVSKHMTKNVMNVSVKFLLK